MAHAILLPWFLLHGAQPLKPDSTGCWLPLKVEHGVNGWDLDPPGSSLECFPDELGIIARADDELVTVLHVSILKWYLGLGLLFAVKVCNRLSFWLVRIQVSSKLRGVQLVSHLLALIIHHLNKRGVVVGLSCQDGKYLALLMALLVLHGFVYLF